jgi:copper transport protein
VRIGPPLAAAAAATCLATVVVGGAAPAGAHATLVGTAPAADGVIDAAPSEVELRYDEAVETVDGAVRVFGPDGDRVDRATVEATDGGTTLRAPVDGDAEGTYTVAWRVTSEDGHTLSGSFVFHVGTRTGAVAVSDGEGGATAVTGGIGRWLGFAGAFVAVGAAAVALLAGRGRPTGRAGDRERRPPDPLAPAGAPAATLTATRVDVTAVDASAGTAPASALAVRARLRSLAAAGALAGAAGVLVSLVATLAESAGRGLYGAIALVPDLAPETRTGQLALARAGLGVAAAAAAMVGAVWRRSPLAVLVLGLASLFTASLAGHAWTAPDRWLAVASDATHLTALAAWTGGLVALLAALPLAPERGRLATRFSGLAVVAVVVVGVTGTVSGWQQVRTLDALTATTYGKLLLAKVAGFAVLVGLGYLNRSRLVGLVERTVAPLSRSLRVETAVAGVVLALAAALVHQAPARATVSEPFATTVTTETGAALDVTVDPARAGPNDIHLFFVDDSGTAPLAVDAVQVTAATTGVPARRLPVTPVSTNHVTVAGASLPSPGTWTIEVTAVQAGEPLVFTFEVPIR